MFSLIRIEPMTDEELRQRLTRSVCFLRLGIALVALAYGYLSWTRHVFYIPARHGHGRSVYGIAASLLELCMVAAALAELAPLAVLWDKRPSWVNGERLRQYAAMVGYVLFAAGSFWDILKPLDPAPELLFGARPARIMLLLAIVAGAGLLGRLPSFYHAKKPNADSVEAQRLQKQARRELPRRAALWLPISLLLCVGVLALVLYGSRTPSIGGGAAAASGPRNIRTGNLGDPAIQATWTPLQRLAYVATKDAASAPHDWQPLDRGTNVVLRYDRNSLLRQGDVVSVLQDSSALNEQGSAFLAHTFLYRGTAQVHAMYNYLEFDCTIPRGRVLGQWLEDADGRIIKVMSGFVDWKPLPNGFVSMRAKICAGA